MKTHFAKLLTRSLLTASLVTLSALSLSCSNPTVSQNATSQDTPNQSITNDTATAGTVPAPRSESLNIPVGVADPKGRANMVISPYRPYNLIDVTGYRSGEIVGDPSTARVNSTTGKLDPKSAKFFRLP